MVILQSTGEDFAATRAILVYQDHHRKIRKNAIRIGRLRRAIPFVVHQGDNYALFDKMAGHVHHCSYSAAGIVAQVQDDTGSILQIQHLESCVELIIGAVAEAVDLDSQDNG